MLAIEDRCCSLVSGSVGSRYLELVHRYGLGAPRSRFSPKESPDFSFSQQEEVLERGIELAKAFRTERVRCFDFWRLEDQEPYRNAMNDKLQDAATKTGKQNVILVLENETSCNTATGVEAAQVLRVVKSRWLMLNWDPRNAAGQGEKPYPDGYTLLPKDRIGHCHCKDLMMKSKGADYDWVAMGRGIVDSLGQFKALKRDGYRNAVSLETHWRGAGTAEQSTRQSWAGMKHILENIARRSR